jgi:hypothetical protein
VKKVFLYTLVVSFGLVQTGNSMIIKALKKMPVLRRQIYNHKQVVILKDYFKILHEFEDRFVDYSEKKDYTCIVENKLNDNKAHLGNILTTITKNIYTVPRTENPNDCISPFVDMLIAMRYKDHSVLIPDMKSSATKYFSNKFPDLNILIDFLISMSKKINTEDDREKKTILSRITVQLAGEIYFGIKKGTPLSDDAYYVDIKSNFIKSKTATNYKYEEF